MENKTLSQKILLISVLVVLGIGFLYAIYYFFGMYKSDDKPTPLTTEEKLRIMNESEKNIQPSPLSREEKISLMEGISN